MIINEMIEKIYRKGYEAGRAHGIAQGRAKGKSEGFDSGKCKGISEGRIQALSSSVLSLMDNLDITAEKAVELLCISGEELDKCLEKARKYENEQKLVARILEKVNNEVRHRPMVSFKAVPGEGGLFDCKLGGVPYFPKDAEYPKWKDGEYKDIPLRLLVQLNFDKIPHIENFPEKGILQIFTADNEGANGCDCYAPTDQNGFRVIYHENIITDETKLMSADDIPAPYPRRGIFAVRTDMLLIPDEVTESRAAPSDHRFIGAFLKYYNELSGKKAEDQNDIYDYICDLNEKHKESAEEEQIYIGGYPVIEWDDPREFQDLKYIDYDTVLFEITSIHNPGYDCDANSDVPSYHVIWGDLGSCTFYIPHDKLGKLDFSDVMYYWG